ncbi:RNA polymerase sigma factor [Zunongwangia atlantica]|uniref:RNA polymerase ECF-type sigma factor n=1 Tax=Zunongwangia atlantica 22II14-10F7 TaxID=1185767 RepID=A0A1Y1T550_9FLAO|nr:RNA polymerase sigma-70 factor [Zunongwangia atlantica]ORL46166.1 RNA polymerase ECF-type sigma factor [Zunongwangia atlantica 22II14-10F7]|tara:strand:+ start:38230 stop:38847 length:618 start_codon:yes stop_codon:yes gene_type:complete
MKPVSQFDNNNSLVKYLKDGEEKAYSFLIEKYHRQLFAYALTFVDEKALAQDIVQSAFLKTWQYRKKLNPDYSIKSFLYKTVYNTFINYYRKEKATMILEKKYYENMYEVVDELEDRNLNEFIKIVTLEIEKLPKRCKEVFTLSKKEGLTNKEISEYLNISNKTVEALITKSFKILRKELGDKYETLLFILFPKTDHSIKGITLS